MEEKKVFLRIGAVVSSFVGGLGHNSMATKAWMIPVLSERDIFEYPNGYGEIERRSILIDLRRSLDQFIAPLSPEKSIEWKDVELEGVGVKSDGTRASIFVGGLEKILLNTFGSKWPLGKNIGVLSLEEAFFEKHKKKFELLNRVWPSEGLQPYQALSVCYGPGSSSLAGKRYIGFEGQILEWKGANEAKIRIYKTQPLSEQTDGWFDLTDINTCHFDIQFGKIRGLDINLLNRSSRELAKGVDRGGFFIEIKHAAKLKLLIDPKTPFVAGKFSASIEKDIGVENINILHEESYKDQTLGAISEKICGEGEIIEPENRSSPERLKKRIFKVVDNITTYKKGNSTPPGSFSLDLVGHARDGYLYLGKWRIDAEDPITQAELRTLFPLIRNNNINRLRLLGCFTGIGRSMQALQDFFDRELSSNPIEVLGAARPVSADDFFCNGLTPLASVDLQNAAEAKTPVAISDILDGFWLAYTIKNGSLSAAHSALDAESQNLAVESLSEILEPYDLYGDMYPVVTASSSKSVLLGALEGSPARIEGLLELPYAELLLPARGSNAYHRVTVLFNGYAARIYPVGNPVGWIYRVHEESRSSLLKLVSDGGPILPLAQRKP